MKNKEKLVTLPDYGIAEVIKTLNLHVQEIIDRSKASENLDAFDSSDKESDLIVFWLNDKFDEKKGFAFYLNGNIEYVPAANFEELADLEDEAISLEELVEIDLAEEDC